MSGTVDILWVCLGCMCEFATHTVVPLTEPRHVRPHAAAAWRAVLRTGLLLRQNPTAHREMGLGCIRCLYVGVAWRLVACIRACSAVAVTHTVPEYPAVAYSVTLFAQCVVYLSLPRVATSLCDDLLVEALLVQLLPHTLLEQLVSTLSCSKLSAPCRRVKLHITPMRRLDTNRHTPSGIVRFHVFVC